jgi:hypothetical protein
MENRKSGNQNIGGTVKQGIRISEEQEIRRSGKQEN